ncbi:hypothetical protein LTR85_005618 [Meristemomyces frigidus]|nr:hypothetical protein LTR85_005618 [Meristemomyces frigidus]
MAEPKSGQPSGFRLCDLPPELRNRIYGCIFEDRAPPTIDIFSASHHLPESAVTIASKQLREESLGLYEEAVSRFWDSHTFDLTYHLAAILAAQVNQRAWFGDMTHPPFLHHMLDVAARTTFAPRVRKLTLKYYQSSGSFIAVDLTVVRAYSVTETSDAYVQAAALAHGGTAFMRVAERHGILLYDACRPQYLDVYNVVRTLCHLAGIDQPPAHRWNMLRSLRSSAH